MAVLRRTVEPLPGRRRVWLIIIALVATAAGVALFCFLYGQLPWLIDGYRLRQMRPTDQAAALATDRGDVLKIVAGAGGVAAIVYTARNHIIERKTLVVAQESLRTTRERDLESAALTREGQVTERYTKAISQLASEKMTERLGGIFALERIMRDSEKDHNTVVEVLTAFVRESTRTPDNAHSPQLTPTDVQAALTVLGRRPQRSSELPIDLHEVQIPGARLPEVSFEGVDLSGADLTGVNFTEAHLENAVLAGANLEGARLVDAYLQAAQFHDAILSGANLTGAICDGATFLRANLRSAILRGTRFVGANLLKGDLSQAVIAGTKFTDANLRGAKFDGARMVSVVLSSANLAQASLAGVKELSVRRLNQAFLDASTLLPPNLRFDPASRQAEPLVPAQAEMPRNPPRANA